MRHRLTSDTSRHPHYNSDLTINIIHSHGETHYYITATLISARFMIFTGVGFLRNLFIQVFFSTSEFINVLNQDIKCSAGSFS